MGWTLGGQTELTKLVDCKSFDEFYASYKRLLRYYIRAQAKYQKYQYEKIGSMHPFLEASMLYDGCLEKGRAVFDGGCYYYGGTLENYGNVNSANSLAAILCHVSRHRAPRSSLIARTPRRAPRGSPPPSPRRAPPPHAHIAS